jgi:hypothetical protein
MMATESYSSFFLISSLCRLMATNRSPTIAAEDDPSMT